MTARWYVTAWTDSGDPDPEDEVWTLSRDPSRTGWSTDGGCGGYGLTFADATALADAANKAAGLVFPGQDAVALSGALRIALPYVERVANTKPTEPIRIRRALQARKDARTIRAVLSRIAPDAAVVLDFGYGERRATWGEFLADNADAIDSGDLDVARIERDLLKRPGCTAYGGGGASGEWSIRLLVGGGRDDEAST